TLAAHETAALTVQTAETDAAALEDVMEFSAGVLAVLLPVKAKALPALVRARPESVVFRKGARQKETVIFENRGGVEAKVSLAIGAPFLVEASGFVLAPGTEKEVAISLKSESVSGVQAVLKVGFEGGGFEIPVEAGGSALPVLAPAPRRMSVAAHAKAKREDESSEPAAAQSGSFAATVDSVSAKSAKFRWQGMWPDRAELCCFQQVLTTDEEGELESAFREYTACRFSRQDGVNFATVENLEPGRSYLFRIDEVNAAGSTPVTFAQIRTPSPPVRESFFSLVHVLFGLAIVAGGVAIWQRVRSGSPHF
ncbi:MAG: hypothetical protein ABIZ56_11655, partial [Chthoniobacteraceae bacterium]